MGCEQAAASWEKVHPFRRTEDCEANTIRRWKRFRKEAWIDNMIRKHLDFRRHERSAGILWRAVQAARLYGCTGWCRNNRDGSVVMEVQGHEAGVALVTDIIASGQTVWVQNLEVYTMVPVVNEVGFDVEDEAEMR